MKNKKAIEMAFNWLFAVIAGGIILLLAVYGVAKFMNFSSAAVDTEIAAQFVAILDPAETGIASGKSIKPMEFRKDTRLHFTCDEMFLFGADYYSELLENGKKGSWLVWDKRKENQSKSVGAEFELIWSKSKHKRRMLRHDWLGFLSSQNTKEAQKRLHPTQKPTSLICDIIQQWGINAKIIVDLYLGSGSTLIACEKTNRKCYGMEIDPHYCDVIITRWQEFTGKKAEKIS